MKLMLVVLLLIAHIVTCRAECDNGFMGGKFLRCQSLNSIYDLYWNLDGYDLNLAIHLQGYPDGWVGLGTSINGGMRGADIAIARKVNGQYVLEDRFVPGLEGEPKLDDHQDLTLISATSDANSLTVLFTRKLISCDSAEDVAIQDHETAVIFAYGTSFGYHGPNRGSTMVHFHYKTEEKSLPSSAILSTLVISNYSVPAKDTTYTCVPIELPYGQKYHIVRWRPVITPGMEPYVHHMVLFTCPRGPHGSPEPFECGMAPEDCSMYVFAWSLGQPGNDWLDDYALPIGTQQYGIVQLHYNNPRSVSGLVDSSGLEIYYTHELRKYDIGTFLWTSTLEPLVIPPKRLETEFSSECPAECSQNLPHAVHVVNYFPHMHEIGQKIWVQHIRGDTELPEIHRDDHYDFQRQQSYNIFNKTILPGDRLIAHCVWNSMSRTTNTTGGESSSQEMCVIFLQYYPAVPTYMVCMTNLNGEAVCGGTGPVTVAPYTYTPLPAPSVCDAEEESKSEEIPNSDSAANRLTLTFVSVSLLVVLLL